MSLSGCTIVLVERPPFTIAELSIPLQTEGVIVIGPVDPDQASAILDSGAHLDAIVLKVQFSDDELWRLTAELDRQRIPIHMILWFGPALVGSDPSRLIAEQRRIKFDAVISSIQRLVCDRLQ